MRFTLNMNREATNVKDLIINLDEALDKIVKLDNDEAFKSTPNYFPDRKEDDYDTSFSYDLKSEQALRWAKNGVKDLVNTLPLTLIFVNKVKEVLVIDNVSGSRSLPSISLQLIWNSESFIPFVLMTKMPLKTALISFSGHLKMDQVVCCGVYFQF